MTIAIDSPITNDSFLALLDELRNELGMISTTNSLSIGDDDIENAVTKCNEIVDTIAADIVAKHDHKNSGYTHIKDALPANTENNDVFYVGININGIACVFNHIEKKTHTKPEHIEVWYKNYGDDTKLMTGLVWWKILERPTTSDFFDEGSQAFNLGISINQNPYQKNTNEAQHWELGWKSTSDLPF